MGDIKGKIESLTPQKHFIEIKKGKQNPNPANLSSDPLSTNDRLIVPGGNSTATISFVEDKGTSVAKSDRYKVISDYKVVVGPSKQGGRYRIPCKVGPDGKIAVGWEVGKKSGCQRVLVQGSTATIKGTTVTIAVRQTTAPAVTNPTDLASSALPIDDAHWATRYIQALAEKGIMRGYPDSGEDFNTKFRPDSPVIREEFASMVAAANLYFKVPETDRTIPFPDIEPRRWSQPAIALAIRTGFLSGYKDGLFRPTQPIPQEQIMASLAGGLGIIQNPDISLLANYTGGHEVSDWAKPAVAAAIQAGIIVDPGNQVLTPQQRSTRGEVAAFIYRALVYKGVIQEATSPTSDHFLLFSEPNEVSDDPEEQGPEVWVSPQGVEPTLIQADSTGQIEITSLTATVDIQAKPAPGAQPNTEVEYVELGQRYTYVAKADGTYQGRLTVLSRPERRAIVQSEQVQALINPHDWSPEIPPPTETYQRIFQEKLLKKKPVQSSLQKSAKGDPLRHVTVIDLTDPDTLLTIGLGKGAPQESDPSYGNAPFSEFVDKPHPGAAVVASGTFFNTDAKSNKFNELYGNMVGGGQFLRYQPWEARGTALRIGEGNRPEMITLKDLQGQTPLWSETWFYLTAGPRLLKAGTILAPGAPAAEGFQAAHLTDINQPAPRSAAIGFSKDGHKLYLVTFLTPMSLKLAAEAMKAIGCHEAMNLDGGASIGLAVNGETKVAPTRNLTNALVVYDVNHPAPDDLRSQWDQFQAGDRRPQIPPAKPPGTPPKPPVSTSNLNARIVQALNAKGKFDTSAGPTSGAEACVWAVNRILEQAGIPTLKNLAGAETNYVPDVEEALIAGRGQRILPSPDKPLEIPAQPGDLVIAAEQVHMGICLTPTLVRSNSSTPKKFMFESEINFGKTDDGPGRGDTYYGTPSKVYRLLQ